MIWLLKIKQQLIFEFNLGADYDDKRFKRQTFFTLNLTKSKEKTMSDDLQSIKISFKNVLRTS